MNKSISLYWFLGTDDIGQWHQRIILSSDENTCKKWWHDSLGRDPELVIDYDTLENSMGVLDELKEKVAEDENDNIYAVWMDDVKESKVFLLPIVTSSTQEATKLALDTHPTAKVLAVVSPWPLLDTLARMRAIMKSEMEPDEVLLG